MLLLHIVCHLPTGENTYKTDEELLSAFRKSGDNTLMGLLLQRYTMLLLGVAMKYLKDKTAAEDAVQHVFMKAISHLPKDDIQNFKGWLYVLMRNHCLQQLRDKHYHTDEAILYNVSATEDDKEDRVWKEATLEAMQSAIMKLEPEQKLCIQLFYMQKQSYKQIMEQTKFTFEQVKSYIQNGKRNLKLILTQKK